MSLLPLPFFPFLFSSPLLFSFPFLSFPFLPYQETKYEAWIEFLSNLPDASEHLFLSRNTSLSHSLLLILFPTCTTHESDSPLYCYVSMDATLLLYSAARYLVELHTDESSSFVPRSSFLVPPSSLDSSVAFCILGLSSKTTPPRYPGSLYKTAFPARSSSRIPPPHPRLPSIRENSTDSSLPPLYNSTSPLLVVQ